MQTSSNNPWPQPDNAILLIGILCAFTLAILAWVLALRRAVRARTRALRESEQKFQAFFQLSPIGMGISRVTDGILTDVNDAYAELLRLPKSEIIGKTAIELNLFPSMEVRTETLRQLQQKRELRNVVFNLQRTDGTHYVNMTSAALVELEGVEYVVASTVDITQRVVAEEALAASKRRFEAIFNHSPIGMILSRLSDGMITEVNPGYVRMMGYQREELVGKTSVEAGLLEPSVRAYWAEQLSKSTVIRDIEFEVKRKDGSRAIHSTSVEIIDIDGEKCVLLSAIDVTAAKETSEALEKSDRKFQTLFKLNPAAIAFAHARSGTLLEVNQAFEELHGIPIKEAVGKTATELGIYPSAAVRDQFLQQLLAHGRIRGAEITRTRSDGSTIVVSGNAELLELDGDQFLISAALDVTALKTAEENLRKMNATLERRVAERTDELQHANQELEAFCYSVSHDLRAPLRSINGFSQALEEDYSDKLEGEAKDFLRRIRAGVLRMSDLIDNLLELSRVGRIEVCRTEVDLTQVASEVVSSLENAAPNRNVRIIISEGLVAYGDRSLLKILLDNLLGNAWKYTSHTEDAIIEFSKSVVDGRVVYFVRDNGVGFEPQYANKLFQPFQRLHTPNEFPGHGIGLATVRRIVQRHGGQVWAEGAVGGGATLSFTLGSSAH